MSWPFWVVVEAGQSVYDAIKAGEWYVSKIAAEATADQFRFINKKQYFVIGNDLEQQPLDVVDQTPDFRKPIDKSKIERTIADMTTGETGYVVPWALSANRDDIPYLRLSYTVHKERGGTVQMLVQKLGDGWYQIGLTGDKLHREHPNPTWDICYNLNII